jgi:hypothetical protein
MVRYVYLSGSSGMMKSGTLPLSSVNDLLLGGEIANIVFGEPIVRPLSGGSNNSLLTVRIIRF